jgi:ATP-dependent Lhr-like helicase
VRPTRGAGPGTRVLYVSPIKALAVDVERNLAAPLAGLTAQAAADGVVAHAGDRGGAQRRHQRARAPGDRPRRGRRAHHHARVAVPDADQRRAVGAAHGRGVIVDEIHALCGDERGAHLALSLERLEHLVGRPLQRVGLSATVRPLDEVARFLAGARPVTIVDAAGPKALALTIEMPFAEPGRPAPPAATNWELVFPRLRALIESHTSTLVFVNSRRLAERTAGAINELAGTTLVHAHHGSVAKEQRAAIEDALKRGALRGLIATSSLELGIDMGAIDLVVQVEPPPSVASGLQRVGRAGHQVGATSTGRDRVEAQGRRAGVRGAGGGDARRRGRAPAATCETPSTSWRSSWWRWRRSSRGASTTPTRW